MNILSFQSESLVTSLCREIEFIRIRKKIINDTLKYCRNENLSIRLNYELKSHETRVSCIYRATKGLLIDTDHSISLSFLKEVIQRASKNQQITL